MDDPADQRSVFPDFAAAKGCPSEKVLCGQSGFLQNIFRVSTNNMTRLSWMKRFWISRWYTKWIILVLEPQNGHSSSFLPDCIWKMTFPIRGFCIGKKNRVMIDTVAGAMSSAIIYSIAETAKANSLKPYDYFELPGSQNIWMIQTVPFRMTCSPGHRTSLRTAESPVKKKWNKTGANLFLSYRFAPVLYRYSLSTVYVQRESTPTMRYCNWWYTQLKP